MSREQRSELLQTLEVARGRRVISLVLGDRPGGLETRIAPDLVPIVASHLRAIGPQKGLDLVLYSTGGDIMAGYRLVSLLREYCEELTVLVPFKCQSTATLISLGANEIIMLPEGQLSPVDPSITGPYNPPIPGVPFQPGMAAPVLPVSVEEVMSYVLLAKEVGVSDAGIASVFDRLTSDVRPLALGQVYRARTQIRMLSRRLLQDHLPSEKTDHIDEIVTTLAEKLYSHDYLISRREAKSIGLNVTDATGDVEQALVALMSTYAQDLSLYQPFNPMAVLQAGPHQARFTIERAYAETTDRCQAFVTDRTLAVQAGGGGQISDQLHFEGWKTL
jgi:hypothetical protein